LLDVAHLSRNEKFDVEVEIDYLVGEERV
jgi:hypothetical protein